MVSIASRMEAPAPAAATLALISHWSSAVGSSSACGLTWIRVLLLASGRVPLPAGRAAADAAARTARRRLYSRGVFRNLLRGRVPGPPKNQILKTKKCPFDLVLITLLRGGPGTSLNTPLVPTNRIAKKHLVKILILRLIYYYY